MSIIQGIIIQGCIFLLIISSTGLIFALWEYLSKTPTCSLCDKPVMSDHPEADVYHLSCLKKKL